MLRIDETLLEDVGLSSLPKEERVRMLHQVRETLEIRVGMRLAENMSDEQLKEFETLVDSNNKQGAVGWLETNFPNYKKVVSEELLALTDEIKRDADKIRESVGQGG